MKQKEEVKGQNVINVNIPGQNSSASKKEPIYVQSAKWVTESISNAKWSKIFKIYFVLFAFLVTGIVGFYAYNIVKNEKFVEKSTNKFLVDERKKESIRDDITPMIQRDIETILYSLNADRVFIFELHNGVTNPSGLPFAFANMNYEVVNRERNIDRVYEKYKDVPLTMYTYPEYMRKYKFFIGTSDEIADIDYEFAKRLKNDGGKFVAMVYMSNGETPLGFLGVSFHDVNRVPQHDLIENKVKSYGIVIGELLDLKKQLEKKFEKELNEQQD